MNAQNWTVITVTFAVSDDGWWGCAQTETCKLRPKFMKDMNESLITCTGQEGLVAQTTLKLKLDYPQRMGRAGS